MAGLLDLPDFNSAAGQGLLAASLSLMGAQKMPGQKGAFGSALANAGRTYMDTRNQAGEQLQAQEYKRLQLDALKRKIEQEKQQATEAERVRNLIAGAGQPMPGMGGTNLVNDALPPDLQIGALKPLQEPGKIDYQALVRSGVPYELVKQLADSQNLGRQKVARTADIEGPNGSKLVQGYDDYGQPVGQGVNGYVAPVSVNQGNQTSFVKPMAGLSLPMGMSPAEQSAANDRNRTFGLQQQKFEFDKGAQITEAGGPSQAPLVKLFGKPETGFRWKPDGSSEPIPGGSKDLKAGELGAKTDARKQSSIAQANVVLDTVKEAKELVGMSTAGYGSWLAGMPNTDARNLAGKLTTIKANLGFDRLQQMRDQSPTGGALGQVAVQELTALQATVASLDQGQTADQLNAALAKIEKHYNNWLKTMEGGTPAAPDPATPPKPMKGMVRNGYKFKGGDPTDKANWERQ